VKQPSHPETLLTGVCANKHSSSVTARALSRARYQAAHDLHLQAASIQADCQQPGNHRPNFSEKCSSLEQEQDELSSVVRLCHCPPTAATRIPGLKLTPVAPLLTKKGDRGGSKVGLCCARTLPDLVAIARRKRMHGPGRSSTDFSFFPPFFLLLEQKSVFFLKR
jgi:hypothetical protein